MYTYTFTSEHMQTNQCTHAYTNNWWTKPTNAPMDA